MHRDPARLSPYNPDPKPKPKPKPIQVSLESPLGIMFEENEQKIGPAGVQVLTHLPTLSLALAIACFSYRVLTLSLAYAIACFSYACFSYSLLTL